MEKLAGLISMVFQPSAAALILYALAAAGDGGFWGFIVAATFSSILPLAFTVAWAEFQGDEWDLPRLQSRRMPLLFAFVSNTAGALVGYLALGLQLIPAFMAIFGAASLAAYALSSAWKVSIHGMALAIVAVCIYYVSGPAAGLAMMVVTVAVGWARIRLGRHSLGQVAAGVFMGLVLAYAGILAL